MQQYSVTENTDTLKKNETPGNEGVEQGDTQGMMWKS